MVAASAGRIRSQCLLLNPGKGEESKTTLVVREVANSF